VQASQPASLTTQNYHLFGSKALESNDNDRYDSNGNTKTKSYYLSSHADSTRPNAYSYTTYSNQPKSNLSLFDKQYDRVLSLLNTNSINSDEASRNLTTILATSTNSTAKPTQSNNKILTFDYKHQQQQQQQSSSQPQNEQDSNNYYYRSKSV
jgi:hypothetical protein